MKRHSRKHTAKLPPKPLPIRWALVFEHLLFGAGVKLGVKRDTA